MKILVTYYSGTGNTEKVAQSIKEGLEEEGQDVTLIPTKDVDLSTLKSYDLMVLGSGVYGGNANKSAVSVVKKAESLPDKIALFCTHMQPTGDAFKRLKKTIEKVGVTITGEFDCPGKNTTLPPELIKKMIEGRPPDKREEAVKWFEEVKERPNADDLSRAKDFGKSLVK